MKHQENPINARPKRRPHRFERVSWLWQRWVVWPLQDRRGLPGGPNRAVVGWGAIAAFAALGATAVALAGPGLGSDAPTVAVIGTEQPQGKMLLVPPEQEKAESAPTLQGATPVFESAVDDSEQVGSDERRAAAPADQEGASTSAATDTISSAPSSSSPDAAAEAAASAVAVDGPPAGPVALAVARDFADAFVVYETGGEKAGVRRVFAQTTTPELSRTLLRRPPRLPAEVTVPTAKVVNVVAGPSHGGVFTISVSLLRVGVTSELRLDMEKLKDHGWRVTNVLG